MKLHKILLAALFLTYCSLTVAADVNTDIDIEAEMAKAKEMTDVSNEYQSHLEAKENRGKYVRGRFDGDFKFKTSFCGIGSMTGGGYKNTSDCDCPKGNKKLGCLVSAMSYTQFAQEDLGGVGYVLLFADDGENKYLMIDGQWQSFSALKRGKASYIIPKIEGRVYEYKIPFNRGACGTGSGMANIGNVKSYRIFAGYGVADTKDIKYLEMANRNGLPIEEGEFIWSAARIDGFRTKNASQIGYVTCN